MKAAILITTVCIAMWAVGGYLLFTRDHQDTLRHADAIVVLGGEHDGREDLGLRLAREGYASTVLISDPYRPYHAYDTDLMNRVCGAGTATIEVICFVPDPSTTEGEAIKIGEMARQRGWRSVIVVTWRWHLVRARYIISQCFAGDVVMRSVPHDYPRSPTFWAWVYTYQFAGMAKAAIVGCGTD